VKCCGRPEYAPESSDEGEEDEVEFSLTKQPQQVVKVAADVDRETKLDAERDDRRLRRLHDRQQEDVDSDEDREARCVAGVAVCSSNDHFIIFISLAMLECCESEDTVTVLVDFRPVLALGGNVP